MTQITNIKYIIFFIICFFLLIHKSFGQIIHVTDAETGRSLSYVNIYTPDHSVIEQTDAKGIASLDGFIAGDTLIFSHIGYEQRSWIYPTALQQEPYIIELNPSSIGVEEIIVSAHRWEQSSREVPATIDHLSAEEIRAEDPQTAADLLDLSGTVFIQKSQMGGGSPMLRGFATNRVLLVVDGVRMNTAIFRGGNIQNVISLDAQSIAHTEVLFGPGSVIYGSDALGGVMDFHTLQAKYSVDDSWRTSGRASLRYNSANDERTVHGHFKAGKGNWASVTSFTHSDYGNLTMGSVGPDDYLREEYATRINDRDTIRKNPDPQVQRPTAFSQWNLLQKLAWRPVDAWELQANLQYSESSDIPRYDRLIQRKNDRFRNATWYYGPQVWGMAQLRARHSAETALYDQMRIIGAYQQFRESRHDRRWQENWLRHRWEGVDAWSLNLDFDKSIRGNWTIYYGLEGVYNGISSTAEEENILSGQRRAAPSRYPDGSDWQSYAAYSNLKWSLGDAWTLQGGIRLNWVKAHASFDSNFYDFPFRKARLNRAALTGSFGATYSPSADQKFYFNTSTGFRAPNIDDLGKVFDSEPGSVVVPNPDLRAEYAYNAEIGGHHRFGSTEFEWAGYYTILDDALARRPFRIDGRDSIVYDGVLSEILAIQNVSTARVYGLQLQVEGSITQQLHWQMAYNWQEGEEIHDEESDEYVPLRHAAPPFGRAKLAWEGDQWGFAIQGEFNQEFKFEDLSLSERGKPHLYALNGQGKAYSPAWWILNIRGSYKITESTTVRASLDNLLDKRYRPYSSGIAGAGRSVTVSVEATFN